MMEENRRVNTSKEGFVFYQLSIAVFWIMSIAPLVYCFIDEFTDTRIALCFLNGWFALFTMNMMNIRFRRESEHQFWYNWIIFRRKGQPKYSSASEIIAATEYTVISEPTENNADFYPAKENTDFHNKKDVA
jgi:hypothetical protein